MSTHIYQFTSNQNTPVQPQSNALKEVSIDVDQLIELNKNDLTEFKNSGLKSPADFMKHKKVMAHGAPIQDDAPIQFKKPPRAYFEKKEVFLPKENEKYSHPTGSDLGRLNSQGPHVSYTQGQHVTYSQGPAQVVYSQAQPQIVYQNAPQVVYQTSPQVVYTQPQTKVVYGQPVTYANKY